jgi:NgoMIV restriction enzyme
VHERNKSAILVSGVLGWVDCPAATLSFYLVVVVPESVLESARQTLHRALGRRLWTLHNQIPSNADKDNRASVEIGLGLAAAAGIRRKGQRLKGSAAGSEFERLVSAFLADTFPAFEHMRPGSWNFASGPAITEFEQYSHLTSLQAAAKQNPELAAALGSDYTIKPDIVISRSPEPDSRINEGQRIVSDDTALNAPLREVNNNLDLLHASISCKWTIRSDRSQNSRSEGLNLVRNRKGRCPHVAVVTAEPLPSRIASIAIGTGDIDCTYHVALHELRDVLESSDSHGDATELLRVMIEGKRLRDISDLPLDLVT